DLAFTACDIDLETGLFTALELTHLVPQSRLTENYLLRLVENISYSGTILSSFRSKVQPRTNPPLGTLVYRAYRFLKYSKRERSFIEARERGAARARAQLSEY